MRYLRIGIFVISMLWNIAARSQTYEFFQAQNYHNQLRLNTLTGEVYQVQDDDGMWLVCSAITPTSPTPCQYWLYPTGEMWQFRWSTENDDSYRWI